MPRIKLPSKPRANAGDPKRRRQLAFRGDRLHEARQIRLVTQADLAQRIGMTRTTITMLESGFSEPSVTSLVQLAMTLNVSTDWLMDLSDEMERR